VTTIKVYIATGEVGPKRTLLGRWLELPMVEDELRRQMDLFSDDGAGAYYLADWETPGLSNLKIDDNDDLEELNALAQRLDDLHETDRLKVDYLCSNGMGIDDAFEKYEDVTFYPEMRLKDVAEELVDEGRFGEIPKTIANYIDYEAIGRDLRHDGYEETNEGVFAYHG